MEEAKDRLKWEERIVTDDPLDKYGIFRRRWYCPVCDEWQTYGPTPFCANCGANMKVWDDYE